VVAAVLPKLAGGLVFCWDTLEVTAWVTVEAPELAEELTCKEWLGGVVGAGGGFPGLFVGLVLGTAAGDIAGLDGGFPGLLVGLIP